MGKRIPNRCKNDDHLISKQIENSTLSNTATIYKWNHAQTLFVQFLKEVHQQLRNTNKPNQYKQNAISQVMFKLMDFFNFQRYYTKIELECYFICLANFLNIVGNQVEKIAFERQFKNKVKVFLQQINETDENDPTYHNKVQAIFCILVLFIYQQHTTVNSSLKQTINRIFSDKGIIKSLLDIHISKNYKVSKLYGVIILQIIAKSQSKIIKQCILKSIFCNLNNITHESTLFNLLVHLRNYKNKVKISLQDVKDGQIITILIQNYKDHILKYQSFYVLDYLNHLIFLFPCLAQQAMQSSFIQFLLENTSPITLHHPLHEAIIISLLKNGLRFSEFQMRQAIIHKIINVLSITNIYTRIKIAKVIIELQKCESLMIYMTGSNIFNSLIQLVNPRAQRELLEKILEFLACLVKKLQLFNPSISKYIVWVIKSRLSNMKDRHIFKILQGFQNEE